MTEDQVAVAVLWLRSNEGDNGEADACNAVADWLEAKSSEDHLRREARKAGIPVARLRKRLAEIRTQP